MNQRATGLAGSRAAVLLAAGLLVACGGGGGGGAPAAGPGAGGGGTGPVETPGYRVSGSVTAAEFIAVDNDTNDAQAAPSQGNNSQSTAQLIPNPGNVGGYANEAGAGNPGPSRADGDPHDFYRINLLAGQTVRLTISDHDPDAPARNDLDLLLVDLDNVVVDYSATLNPDEQVTVPVSREYVIVVSVCADELFLNPPGICGAGASNYLLSVAQDVSDSGDPLRVQRNDFVPGEAIALLGEPVSVEASEDIENVSRRPRRVERVRFRTPNAARGTLVPALRRAEFPEALIADTAQRERLATLGAIKQLVRTGAAVWAEPNFIRRPTFEPDDPGYEFQWHYPQINLPAAWDLTVGDPNVAVAVIDTGILPDHPDIQGQLVSGYDFVSDPANAGDGDGMDADPTDPGDGQAGFRSSFHGTHVSGTVAAGGNNGRGVTGVAYGARVMPLRALGLDGGSVFDIRRAMCFAAGLSGTTNCPADPAIPTNPNPVEVINLSLGGASFSQAEQNLIDEITAAGVTVVAAAGNDSSSAPFYPAAYDNVIAVSASTIENRLASYSNFGNYVDVAAPGGSNTSDVNGDGYPDGVLSTGGDDSEMVTDYVYPFFQGTSMAAPHVAGVFALMKSVNSDLTPADFAALLMQGALTDADEPGTRTAQFGYGIINAQKAVAAALEAGGSPPAENPWLSLNPESLNFGATLSEVAFELRNATAGELNILSITSDQPWLIAPPTAGLGEYVLRVDRDGLVDGTYSGLVTIVSNVNTVKLPVIMQVTPIEASGNAGRITVRLRDNASGAVHDVSATASDGVYDWTIEDVPAGEYTLFAFSDADNDGQVCDAGEACGAYRTTDQPLVIAIDANDSGFAFPVSYSSQAPQ